MLHILLLLRYTEVIFFCTIAVLIKVSFVFVCFYLEFWRTDFVESVFSGKSFFPKCWSFRVAFRFQTFFALGSPERHDPGKARSQEPWDQFRGSGVRTRVSGFVRVRGGDVQAQAAAWNVQKGKKSINFFKLLVSSI